MLKAFFEQTIEQDDFEKLKDGYVVLDSKTNMCYFKRSTLNNWLSRPGNKKFKNTMEAFQLLGCKRYDYFEGVQNVWYVTMPEFVKHVHPMRCTNDDNLGRFTR